VLKAAASETATTQAGLSLISGCRPTTISAMIVVVAPEIRMG
jgi:hypothetical protein